MLGARASPSGDWFVASDSAWRSSSASSPTLPTAPALRRRPCAPPSPSSGRLPGAPAPSKFWGTISRFSGGPRVMACYERPQRIFWPMPPCITLTGIVGQSLGPRCAGSSTDSLTRWRRKGCSPLFAPDPRRLRVLACASGCRPLPVFRGRRDCLGTAALHSNGSPTHSAPCPTFDPVEGAKSRGVKSIAAMRRGIRKQSSLGYQRCH